jgi:hypothetical protein
MPLADAKASIMAMNYGLPPWPSTMAFNHALQLCSSAMAPNGTVAPNGAVDRGFARRDNEGGLPGRG